MSTGHILFCAPLVILWVKSSQPHFTGEETEAHRSSVASQVSQIESSYAPMPHLGLPASTGPRTGYEQVAGGGRRGKACAKSLGNPVKELCQDIVLPTCAHPCAGVIGADKDPPSPASRGSWWHWGETITQGPCKMARAPSHKPVPG